MEILSLYQTVLSEKRKICRSSLPEPLCGVKRGLTAFKHGRDSDSFKTMIFTAQDGNFSYPNMQTKLYKEPVCVSQSITELK